jgi:sorting nexin-4
MNSCREDLSLVSIKMTSPQITEPLKHGEGSQSFISYLVTHQPSSTSTSTKIQVRRRFQDFILLHQSLLEQYPQCIIPPLPSKHRIEYVTGDRFSTDFIQKRIISLQSFLDRIRFDVD